MLLAVNIRDQAFFSSHWPGPLHENHFAVLVAWGAVNNSPQPISLRVACPLDRDPFDLVERYLILPPVVKLRRPGRFMIGDVLRHF